MKLIGHRAETLQIGSIGSLLTTGRWALIFIDEASFRQDSTLYATWNRVGRPPEIPVTGELKSIKILGAIELFQTQFHYRQDTVFNASYHRIETCGDALARIDTGWKSTNSQLTRPS